jgi:hypothetical protein
MGVSGDARACPHGVKSCPDSPEVQLPLYTRKRTQLGHRAMSEKCQEATSRNPGSGDAAAPLRWQSKLLVDKALNLRHRAHCLDAEPSIIGRTLHLAWALGGLA